MRKVKKCFLPSNCCHFCSSKMRSLQLIYLCIIVKISSFSPPTTTERLFGSSKLYSSTSEAEDPASKFKIVTCFSTSCDRRRKQLGLDSLSTFGSFYSRAKENAPSVTGTKTVAVCIFFCNICRLYFFSSHN